MDSTPCIDCSIRSNVRHGCSIVAPCCNPFSIHSINAFSRNFPSTVHTCSIHPLSRHFPHFFHQRPFISSNFASVLSILFVRMMQVLQGWCPLRAPPQKKQQKKNTLGFLTPHGNCHFLFLYLLVVPDVMQFPGISLHFLSLMSAVSLRNNFFSFPSSGSLRVLPAFSSILFPLQCLLHAVSLAFPLSPLFRIASMHSIIRIIRDDAGNAGGVVQY